MNDRHIINSVEPVESVWQPGPNSQFFRSQKDWEADPRARLYGHQLRRAWDKDGGLGLWAVLCIEGKPTVYFKRVQRKELALESEWQRRLWNQGTATMLVVQDAQEVRVYSGLARPEELPPLGTDDARLIEVFDYVASSLELSNFIRSVETGQFYRDHPSKFQTDRAVDKYLLDNLGEARDQLCDPNAAFPLLPSTAHAFLGRCLFTCYLLEREIIGRSQLARAGANGPATRAKTLRDVLRTLSATEATQVLYGLFRVLKDDFNGSMFGGRLAGEKSQIRKSHIDILVRFLSGDEMKTHQGVLFPLYDFRLIPIEFISAVYEDFLAAEDIPTSEKKSGSQRKAGAYYTPPRLAELVVDIATEDWETLLGKRCLDPACGSGIFLVILFQRMAEEWRRRNPRATNTKRARALRDLLMNNLCGVDVNETACMVTCFSLYLAFMDQFDDPRDIWALADELRKSGTEKVLPLLMASDEGEDEDEPNNPAIYVANFFGSELPDLNGFDLSLGNPPWVGRNQPADQVLEEWILNEPTEEKAANPFVRDLPDCPRDKASRRSWFLPDRRTVVAFMWKAPLHVKSSGTVCFLLPSKVLLGHQVNEFQMAWFRRFQVDVIWQLADYRFILFAGAKHPAAIIRYHPEEPAGDTAEIKYVTPKVTGLAPHVGEIQVLSEDSKMIRISEVLEAASQGQAFTVWKKHFWGTGRDQELIARLLMLPRLHLLAGEPHEGKRLIKGQGFKPFNEEKYLADPERYGEPKPRWWSDTDLFLDANTKGWNWFLLKEDCRPIGNDWSQLHRGTSDFFKVPAVITNQGFTKFAFTDFPVLFRSSLQSISAGNEDVDILLFLTAVLNSPLSAYFLFHTSANRAIERDKILFAEVLSLPFPLPEDTRRPRTNRRIFGRIVEMIKAGKADSELASNRPLGLAKRQSFIGTVQDEIFSLIYEYYSLSDWEQILVEETVSIFEPSATPTLLQRNNTRTQKETDRHNHQDYAELLCATLNGWLPRQPWKLSAALQVASKAGLGLLTIRRTENVEDFVERPAGREFEKILVKIQRAVSARQSGISYARGFTYFEPEQFHILKPLTLRHWSKTAALNDADALMGFMVSGGRP